MKNIFPFSISVRLALESWFRIEIRSNFEGRFLLFFLSFFCQRSKVYFSFSIEKCLFKFLILIMHQQTAHISRLFAFLNSTRDPFERKPERASHFLYFFLLTKNSKRKSFVFLAFTITIMDTHKRRNVSNEIEILFSLLLWFCVLCALQRRCRHFGLGMKTASRSHGRHLQCYKRQYSKYLGHVSFEFQWKMRTKFSADFFFASMFYMYVISYGFFSLGHQLQSYIRFLFTYLCDYISNKSFSSGKRTMKEEEEEKSRR